MAEMVKFMLGVSSHTKKSFRENELFLNSLYKGPIDKVERAVRRAGRSQACECGGASAGPGGLASEPKWEPGIESRVRRLAGAGVG